MQLSSEVTGKTCHGFEILPGNEPPAEARFCPASAGFRGNDAVGPGRFFWKKAAAMSPTALTACCSSNRCGDSCLAQTMPGGSYFSLSDVQDGPRPRGDSACTRCHVDVGRLDELRRRALASRSSPGRSFTWRMNLPVPSNRPPGSGSSAPRKKSNVHMGLEGVDVAETRVADARRGMAVMQQFPHIASPHWRMTSNQRCARHPIRSVCAFIQVSMAASMLNPTGESQELGGFHLRFLDERSR